MVSVDAEHHERRSLFSAATDAGMRPSFGATAATDWKEKSKVIFKSWHDYVENAQMLPRRVAVDNQVAVLSILLQ